MISLVCFEKNPNWHNHSFAEASLWGRIPNTLPVWSFKSLSKFRFSTQILLVRWCVVKTGKNSSCCFEANVFSFESGHSGLLTGNFEVQQHNTLFSYEGHVTHTNSLLQYTKILVSKWLHSRKCCSYRVTFVFIESSVSGAMTDRQPLSWGKVCKS